MLNKRILTLVFVVAFLTSLTGCITPPNQAPILTSDPITTATVGVEYIYNVDATDPDGDTLTYSLATKPSGMTINSANGLIKWTPTAKGNYAVIVKVSDGDLDIIQSFTIVVAEPPNQAPTASFTASPTSGVVPMEVSFDASSSYDSDGSIISYEWDFKDGNTGSGKIVNHTFSSPGNYNVKLTVTDNKGATDSTTKTIIVTEPIDNEIVYRALCVGVGDYILGSDNDLNAPPYDVDRMSYTLKQCRFGPLNTPFSNIWYLKDWQATKSNILYNITSYCFTGADNNDISYFYFSGHGSRLENTSYLCPSDVNSFVDSAISVDELESALSTIPGTKVVFIDACRSGGFIGKGTKEIKISKEELESFNDEVINAFSQAEYKGLLTTNQYKVLTSCHYYQTCIELYPTVPGTFDPFGVFTMGLCEGCGYSGNYPADTNLDTKVSLQEAYLYTKNWMAELDTQIPHIDITQDIQVYPDNSTYSIIEY